MATEVVHVADRTALSAELEKAGAILRAGGLVAFPTETVYGIAVAADHPESVERLYRIKKRPREQPMTVMLPNTDAVVERLGEIPPIARSLMRRFWPGPLTLVLADAEGRMTGFRVPSSPLARGLVREARVPLFVPSANPHGEPPATTAEQVLAYFPDEIDLVIDGGPSEGAVASTVVRVVDDQLEVLREGAISETRLLATDRRTVLFVCRGNTDRSPLAAAILRRRLAQHLGVEESALEQRGWSIESAGIAATEGQRASPAVRRLARGWSEGPLDLEDHRARKLTSAMIEEASKVFCMEREQREQLLAFFPHRERDVLLVDPEGGDIPDPAGGSEEEFRRLARRLDAAATLIVWGLVRRDA
jgi:tRNA threonylcarbamoyl adenosine modification protein (Sua5/YciO/YrdC/YwlC family)